MLGEIARREDVVRPRLLGSILAFDLKGEASYQSAQSQALKTWFLNRGLNIRPIGSTVYLMPPYCITDEELARAYAGLIEGLDWLAANRP
jgi:adenosylmethionine-8-amino-7-oxononanoate aminotransferase